MSGAPRVGQWLEVLHGLFPPAWAEPWDNVGLQVGDPRGVAARVLVALDPTPDVVDEAAARGCGLLLTHHPLLFRAPSRLDLSEAPGRAVARAIAGGVAVAASHTNADVASPGVSDALAEALGIEVTGVLRPTEAGERVKLVTFVPPEAAAKVLDAIAGAGAGTIGEYTHCSFRVRGSGTFLPSEAAHPEVGKRGELNEVEEDRLEVVVPREGLEAAVQALVDAHPYEEVAYDAYPLAGGGGQGLGRVGRPREPLDGEALASRCRDRLGASVRLAGDPSPDVRILALCGGSGRALIPDALAAGADAFVTGDVSHHAALDAAEAGLFVIDAGHHATEWPFIPRLAERLAEAGRHLGGEVLVSETAGDPFRAP